MGTGSREETREETREGKNLELRLSIRSRSSSKLDQVRRIRSPAGGLRIELTLLCSGVRIMRTYEKSFETRNRGPNYAGVIAVTCLLVSMLAAWAVM